MDYLLIYQDIPENLEPIVYMVVLLAVTMLRSLLTTKYHEIRQENQQVIPHWSPQLLTWIMITFLFAQQYQDLITNTHG